jgi:hypothetical protein
MIDCKKMKAVVVKFCGGCDPAFDRSQLFNEIKSASAGLFQWVGPDHRCPDAMLLICGCGVSCPERDLSSDSRGSLKQVPVVVVLDEYREPAQVIKKIIEEIGT